MQDGAWNIEKMFGDVMFFDVMFFFGRKFFLPINVT